jgi:hypothetical protein
LSNKKLILAAVLVVLAIGFILWDMISHRQDIDAFSGATPQALVQDVPNGLSLTVDGKVKQVYYFSPRALGLLAKTRLRIPEVSPRGEILGAYIYYGIPVIHIMEGIAPKIDETSAFDRPLDMAVIFTSASGQTSVFSYGELTMTDDRFPVTLAFYREPLMPSKDPRSYTRNKYMENIKALRLICPREPNTSRYLDNVVRMTLTSVDTPDHLLPRLQKGKKCVSTSINCIDGGNVKPASYKNVEILNQSGWLRIGHGRGIKGDALSTVSGYSLESFLKENFPGTKGDDFFLVVGCDGYRALFSGREIFFTAAGKTFMLVNTIDGKEPAVGKTLAAVGDFFVDRDVWGVSHIVKLGPVIGY